MTATLDGACRSLPASDRTADNQRRERRARFGWPLATCLLVALLAQLPPLVGAADFYYVGDSSAQYLPTFYHLGQRLLDGHWPLLFDPGMWIGGNIAGAAVYGTWNPLNNLNFLLVAGLSDLTLAALLVKTELLTLLALGVYLVCREYGAARWAASVLGVALPFSGFVLYYQAATWVNGLIGLVWVPLVWWSARRMAYGRCNAVWVFGLGALSVTAGHPYGVLGTAVVLISLVIEQAVRPRHAGWRPVRQLLVVGTAIAALLPLVYLPLLGIADLGSRADAEILNNGHMAPGLGDVLNLSTPTFLPFFWGFGPEYQTVPTTYFAWFVVPVAAWLNWRHLLQRGRQLVGVYIVIGFFAVLALGPAALWMFRWPARFLPYAFLGLAVLTAVLLSQGFRTDRATRRAGITTGLIVAGAYLAWSDQPDLLGAHLLGAALVGTLVAAAVTVWRRRAGRGALVAAVLQTGTAAVLVLQLALFPVNENAPAYNFPSSVAALRTNPTGSYEGTVFQVAQLGEVSNMAPQGAWEHLLFGNLYQVAGVESVNAYAVMGFKRFEDKLCMDFRGGTCAKAYAELFEPVGGNGPRLADAMKLETIVVQRALIANPQVYPGWKIAERNSTVTVLERTTPVPWPGGRVSAADPDIRVISNSTIDERTERLRFRHTGSGTGRIWFSRLAWPGYTATVDGQQLTVRSGPAGLLLVEIPPDIEGGTMVVRWTPPGYHCGLAALALGALTALSLGALQLRRRVRAPLNPGSGARPNLPQSLR